MSFLRKWFGPTQKEIWEDFAHHIRAEYQRGGLWQPPVIRFNHRNWPVIIDTYTVSTGKSSVTYTRIRARFIKRDDFRFTLYRRNFFHNIGKLFGMEDIEVGYPEFDRDFIVQGTDEQKLLMLFKHREIRELIGYQPNINFEIKIPKKKERRSDLERELYFQVVGVIKDPDRLHDLVSLFQQTLNHLYEIGTAEEEFPV